jgi:hypothetical protein
MCTQLSDDILKKINIVWIMVIAKGFNIWKQKSKAN